MKKSILKPIIGGVLFGAIVFFTGPLILIVLLLKFIFTPFGMGRMMMARRFSSMGMGQPTFAFADKVRNMSDDEYTAFQSRFNQGSHYNCGRTNQFN